MGKIREGMWDCTSCQATGILGREKSCPHCGAERPEGTKFYLPEDAPEVTNVSQLAQAHAGPDWNCEHCRSANEGTASVCSHCGAAKGSSPVHAVTSYDLQSVPKSSEEAQTTTEPSITTTRAFVASIDNFRKQNVDWRRFLIPAGIVASLLIVGLILFLIFRTKEIPVTVNGFAWERSVTVDKLLTITEEDWLLPQGAYNVSQRQDIHHYEDVVDHYETKYKSVCVEVPDGYDEKTENVCDDVQTGTKTFICGSKDLGNGYFEDIECEEPEYTTQCHPETISVLRYRDSCHDEPYEEPVYRQEPRFATKYTYQIDRWIFSRTPSSSGTNHIAQWPQVNFATNERESGRYEKYTIFFKNEKGKIYPYNLNFEEWQDFKEGQQVKVKVNALNFVMEVSGKE